MDDMLAVLDKALPVKHIDIQPPARPKRVTYQQAQSISGVTVMMMMFSLTNAGALLLAERERGTLKRLLALPMQTREYIAGQVLLCDRCGPHSNGRVDDLWRTDV